MINPVIQDGNPTLRSIAPAFDFKKGNASHLIALMNSVLVRFPDGVALAAPQIDISVRVFIVSPHLFPDQSIPRTYINPTVIKRSKTKKYMEEGCLSVRGLYGETYRYDKVTVEAYDINGVRFTYGVSGLLSQIFQHEIDHLDGILFHDHARNISAYEAPEIKN